MPALPGHFRSSIIIQLCVDPELIMRYDTAISRERGMKAFILALFMTTHETRTGEKSLIYEISGTARCKNALLDTGSGACVCELLLDSIPGSYLVCLAHRCCALLHGDSDSISPHRYEFPHQEALARAGVHV